MGRDRNDKPRGRVRAVTMAALTAVVAGALIGLVVPA